MFCHISALKCAKLPGTLLFSARRSLALSSTPKLLNQAERDIFLPAIAQNGWKVQAKRDAIEKKYEFRDFKDAFAFMTQVAEHAERLQHHPEWFNVYNRVEVVLSTHDCGGLSSLDIDMANAMDALRLNYFPHNGK
eukprot:gene29007-35012_t